MKSCDTSKSCINNFKPVVDKLRHYCWGVSTKLNAWVEGGNHCCIATEDRSNGKNIVWFYILDDNTGHSTPMVWPTATETGWPELKHRDDPVLASWYCCETSMAGCKRTCSSALHTNNKWTSFSSLILEHEIQTGPCDLLRQGEEAVTSAIYAANSVTYGCMCLIVLKIYILCKVQTL